MVVREAVWTEQVATPDLDAIDTQFLRGDVEQALADEHTMLAAGAAHRRDDRLVREHRREAALVVGDVVRTEQRALRVDGNGQAVRIVGAGIEEKVVAHAEDAAIARQRHLGFVHLAALLRRRVEVLTAILGPLDRTSEAHRHPGHESSSG